MSPPKKKFETKGKRRYSRRASSGMQMQSRVLGILQYIFAPQRLFTIPMNVLSTAQKIQQIWENKRTNKINVFAGSQGLCRSQEEGDVKVVRKSHTNSYYERFCETEKMGLPNREIDFVVMEGHRVDDEEEKMTGNEIELQSEVNGYKETELGFLLASTLHCLLTIQTSRS